MSNAYWSVNHAVFQKGSDSRSILPSAKTRSDVIVPAISLGGHGSFIISAAVRRDTKRSFCLSLLPLETFCKWHKKNDALVSLAAHRRPRHWRYDRAGATTLKPTVHTNAVKTSYLRVVVRSVEKNNSSSTFSGCPLETASKQFHVETITITPF